MIKIKVELSREELEIIICGINGMLGNYDIDMLNDLENLVYFQELLTLKLKLRKEITKCITLD